MQIILLIGEREGIESHMFKDERIFNLSLSMHFYIFDHFKHSVAMLRIN